MKLHNENAEIFIPDDKEQNEAMHRTTHMTIAAHQDDIEIMAYEGIAKCFGQSDKWHFGVVVTDGAGSPRSGIYADYTDEDMQKTRKKEQKKAAYVGEYSALAMLEYPSSQVRDRDDRELIEDIIALVIATKPQTIYTHNLADKHDTHVGVAVKVIKALRELDKKYLPEKIYGCEVWRDLDWMCDEDKIAMDVDDRENIASSLVGVFDSQICGGKRYDLAAAGRRRANATFSTSHGVDQSSSLSYAMDLTHLILNKEVNIAEYTKAYIQKFMDNVVNKIELFN